MYRSLSESRLSLILVEIPRLSFLGQHEVVAVQCGDFQTDVMNGLETERLLDDDGVVLFALDGVALHKETVALMLEGAIDLANLQVL